MRSLLGLHALLLLLASTAFTIVTVMFGDGSLQWCYFRFLSRTGEGGQYYVSDFTLPVVATYLAAFIVGLAGFTLALRNGRYFTGVTGIALSAIGLISFTIEGSHWFFDHHRSWLAFSPALMFVLVVIACLPQRSAIAE